MEIDCIHCRAADLHDQRTSKGMIRKRTENLDFEIALSKAVDLLELEWKPSTLADLEAMDTMVFDLFWQLRRGQQLRERDDRPPTTGKPIASYTPNTADRAAEEADAPA